MARSVYTIRQQIIDSFRADPETPADISTSKVAKWNSWAGISAMAISLFEQILDFFHQDVDARIDRAGIGTSPWILDRIKEFRFGNAVDYDPLTGQFSYPNDSGELIISRAAVSSGLNKVVNVKSATGEPPTALSSTQLEALQTYLNKIGIAGIQYNVTSTVADRMYIEGDVFFDGQYSDSIEISVKTAIRSFYNTLSDDQNFGGKIGVIAIIEAIKNVTGVTDFKLTRSTGRSNADSFPAPYFYSLPTGINNLFYEPQSGYVIEEDAAGGTLDDSLTFIAS